MERAGFPAVAGVRHRHVDAGGLRMHVAEAGRGDPVVLLHGWPQHWYVWRDVMPQLAPHAHVVCPDLRGFGWTDAPASGYELDTMAGDVLALLDALGLARVSFAGHDWGGWIGFLLCHSHPERISRFVALGVLPPWRPRNPRNLLELWRIAYQVPIALPQLGRRVVARSVRAALRAASASFSGEELDAFAARIGGDRARATELLYRTFLLRELVPVAAGRREDTPLRVRTLLIVGERDFAIPARIAREQAAGSEALEVEVVPDAGHFVVDERPDLVADRILRFALAQ